MDYLQGYDVLSEEYYDESRHPTCANFRTASLELLRGWLDPRVNAETKILEVGSGLSATAEILLEKKLSLDNLTITDLSSQMLSHSKKFELYGARLIAAPANAIPVPDGSYDYVVSSLGDPYNDAMFWRECNRVVARDGQVLFTTPSFEWAQQFRDYEGSPQHAAMFQLRDGRSCLVPSNVYPVVEQTSLIESEGLHVAEVKFAGLSSLLGQRVSPKLLVAADSIPVITGYRVLRPS